MRKDFYATGSKTLLQWINTGSDRIAFPLLLHNILIL